MIIETCPKCGHDLLGVQIDIMPPIHRKECHNCGWSWESMSEPITRIPFEEPEYPAMGSSVEITKIPFPNLLLAGAWSGTVYAITTETDNKEEHDAEVEEAIQKLRRSFNGRNHYSVSLREVKRERLYSGVQFCTLVQFRVRDSF